MQMNGGAQRELLIASALPVAANRADHFASRQQAYGLSELSVAQRDDALDVSQHRRLDVAFNQVFGDLDDASEIRFGDPLRFDQRLAIVEQQEMRSSTSVFGVRAREIR